MSLPSVGTVKRASFVRLAYVSRTIGKVIIDLVSLQ